MRLKHFLAEVTRIGGWQLVGERQVMIRRFEESGQCECPLTAVYNSTHPDGWTLGLHRFDEAAKALGLPKAIAAAADNLPDKVLNAPANIAELRRHLLKAAGLS